MYRRRRVTDGEAELEQFLEQVDRAVFGAARRVRAPYDVAEGALYEAGLEAMFDPDSVGMTVFELIDTQLREAAKHLEALRDGRSDMPKRSSLETKARDQITKAQDQIKTAIRGIRKLVLPPEDRAPDKLALRYRDALNLYLPLIHDDLNVAQRFLDIKSYDEAHSRIAQAIYRIQQLENAFYV